MSLFTWCAEVTVKQITRKQIIEQDIARLELKRDEYQQYIDNGIVCLQHVLARIKDEIHRNRLDLEAQP
jgi:hypothetical protein